MAPIDLEHYVPDNHWPKINNNFQVVGMMLYDGIYMAFRDTLSGGLETFPPIVDLSTGNVMQIFTPSDLNDAGEFCGFARITFANPEKIRGQVIDYENLGYVQGSTLETFAMGGFRLNESSDFITWQGELYHRSYIEGGGALLVSDLLDPTDAGAVAWAESVVSYILEGISDRDEVSDPDVITDFHFPQLFGQVTFIDGSRAGFVLSPVAFP